MLTALIFIPLVGALITMFLPKDKPGTIKGFALIVSLIPLVLLFAMWGSFDASNPAMQLVQQVDWIPTIGAEYHVGVDGISFPLLWVTALVSILSIVASWRVDHRVKEFFAWILTLQMAMYGVFLALDYVLFFIFWELLLVPMYFIIGI